MNDNLKFANPVEWNVNTPYFENDIVFDGKKAYTAIQNVPIGTQLTDTEYWRETGTQTEKVETLVSSVGGLETTVSSIPVLKRKTGTGTTTTSGALSFADIGISTATMYVISARVVDSVGYAFWRGDGYLTIYDGTMVPKANQSVTVEVAYISV